MKWKRIADCAVSECRRFMIAPDARGRFVARIYADAESTKHEAESIPPLPTLADAQAWCETRSLEKP